ncbi:PREDICTED: probable S-adenosylmethionine-dependent methyltransferase At5g37990 isoform X1 [Theobroma cacao]|uniref:Probable S-adenosylmethionine-dependent methyltransferase At5g37990 isoform X1 n=1 Tax=Theobroma cacao TaxID=3641 RepID=A0AB32UMR3_THECC|nr:PREDICTED: probable S-adenosylmethionine-dependent methyltransferase At5g37990 isoform X1 [Theobroma cacao]
MEAKSQSIMADSYAMNGGDGPYSYAQNSMYQRGIMETAKRMINEEIAMKLDIQKLSLAASEPIRIADLGCSCGPNTILAIQNNLEALKRKFQTHPTPEFQVFFNDQVSNDFNSLFASLPELGRQYYAACVPGSFHVRLFPTASLHFVYSSCALNWLSKVPKEVVDKTDPAWNQGRIHYTGAPKEVFEAYSDQFAKDIGSFLQARVKELAPGGLMALVIPAVPDMISHPHITTGSEFELVGSCLMDMAKMGIVSEAKIDTFNLPIYYTYPKELRQIIEGNGCFSIERMDILNIPKQHIAMPDLRQRTLYIRAALEALIEKHFGKKIIDPLFEMYSRKLSASPIFLNPENQKTTAIFVLLKPI